MRYAAAIILLLAACWAALFAAAAAEPREGEFILLRTAARPAFYAAHPEISTQILFSGGGLTLYRVLSED